MYPGNHEQRITFPTCADDIVHTIRTFYPSVQVIYLFGSYGTEYEHDESDVDLALLFPPELAKTLGNLAMSECQLSLACLLNTSVDLINLRLADSVFQNIITDTGRILFCIDDSIRLDFESIALSLYQKLNEERQAILDEIQLTHRIHAL